MTSQDTQPKNIKWVYFPRFRAARAAPANVRWKCLVDSLTYFSLFSFQPHDMFAAHTMWAPCQFQFTSKAEENALNINTKQQKWRKKRTHQIVNGKSDAKNTMYKRLSRDAAKKEKSPTSTRGEKKKKKKGTHYDLLRLQSCIPVKSLRIGRLKMKRASRIMFTIFLRAFFVCAFLPSLPSSASPFISLPLLALSLSRLFATFVIVTSVHIHLLNTIFLCEQANPFPSKW